VNVWVSRDTYEREVSAGDESAIDYAALDKVIPHPVYGPQSWLSVLNPGSVTEDKLKDLLAEAHDRARLRYERQRTRYSDKA
jgi:predicted DNA-binding protein (MmcQ/YjbR family)